MTAYPLQKTFSFRFSSTPENLLFPFSCGSTKKENPGTGKSQCVKSTMFTRNQKIFKENNFVPLKQRVRETT